MTHIDEIRKSNSSDRCYLGLVDENQMFDWVHPRDILGVNKSELLAQNISGVYLSRALLEYPDGEYQSDDECIVEYLSCALSHRVALKRPIPIVWLIDALVFLVENYASDCAGVILPREEMSKEELSESFEIFYSAIERTSDNDIKKVLVNQMYYFFCYYYLSPELATMPRLKEFVEDPKNLKRLSNLEKFLG